MEFKVCKVADAGKLVYGWGSICKTRDATGELVDYWDTDNQHFPEDVTELGWREFMTNSRSMDVMHEETTLGQVVYAFPMMTEQALAFDILDALQCTGVMVGVRVDDPAIAAKFMSGEFLGFSIGGSAVYEDVE